MYGMKKRILGGVLLIPVLAYLSWMLALIYESSFWAAFGVVGGGAAAFICMIIGLNFITDF